jgi:integrase/recombinase XerD
MLASMVEYFIVKEATMELVINETSEITKEQYEYILKHIAFEDAKGLVRKQIVKNKFNVDQAFQKFLSGNTDQTADTYKLPIRKFIDIHHPVDTTTEIVDDYILQLGKEYSSASVRLHVAALSSFFNKLLRWGYIDNNPFKGTDLPKVKRERKLAVPNDEEVNEVLSYCADKGIVKAYIAVYLMIHLGVRVGAIADISVKDGRYTAVSKGKSISGDFPSFVAEEVSKWGFDMNNEKPFSEINKGIVQYHLTKICDSLYTTGRITAKCHAHSFRHYFAVKKYKESRDIYEVSRLLNHTSVSITQRYLESLEV